MSKIVGLLNGKAIMWVRGEERPYIIHEDRKMYIEGLPITYAEAFSGIPELTDPEQVGAIGRWGALFKLYPNGSWNANNVSGHWSLVPA